MSFWAGVVFGGVSASFAWLTARAMDDERARRYWLAEQLIEAQDESIDIANSHPTGDEVEAYLLARARHPSNRRDLNE